MKRSVSRPTAPGVSLATLAARQAARITGFDLPPERRARLLEMGMTTGTEIEVIRFAPLGDPIEIEVRGYRLSLRKREARGIRVVCL
ncbi:MAG: FeoA family protein [Verrucomicrobiota bacterium]